MAKLCYFNIKNGGKTREKLGHRFDYLIEY